MLKLENINISFDKKTIFTEAFFQAERGKLTIIQGKSGIGKSTLINTILFQYPCQRWYEDEDLSELSEDDASDFLFQNVSVVYQEPLFNFDLTIAENRDFLMQLHHMDNSQEKIMHLLHLDKLLSKYPSSLSGGEKTRCAVWLSLIKQPEILILDEPTASLNEENKDVMIRILKEFAQNHIVICSSHDQALINAGDAIYRIEDQKAVLYRTSEQEEALLSPTVGKQNDFNKYGFYNRKEMKHHRFASLARVILPAGCLTFLCTSLSLNNVALDRAKQSLNELSSEELLIYYELDGADYYDTGDDWISSYTYGNNEWAIPEEIANKLYELDNIAYITPRIDAFSWHGMTYVTNEQSYHIEKELETPKITLYEHQELINQLTVEEAQFAFFDAYTEEMMKRNRKAVICEFGNEGVLITEQLLIRLFGSISLDNPEIEVLLPVPVYSTSGNAQRFHINPEKPGDPMSEILIDVNFICGHYEKVRYPVRGVVKSQHSFGLSPYQESIFIPYEDWRSRIDFYQKDPLTVDERTRFIVHIYNPITHSQVNEEYFNELPDQYKSIEKYEAETGEELRIDINHDTLWTPCGYTAFVEDLARIHETVHEIQLLGLTVSNDYIDTSHIILVQESVRKALSIISGLVTAVVLIGYLVIQYIQRDNVRVYRKYLSMLGFRSKNQEDFIRSKRVSNASILTAVTLAAYTTVRIILLSLHTTFIAFDIRIYLGATLICVLCEYYYPLMIDRKKI